MSGRYIHYWDTHETTETVAGVQTTDHVGCPYRIDQPMSTETHGSLEAADQRAASTTDHSQATRVLYLDTATPVVCAGATVIFCECFERTSDGQRYDGDVPLFILDVANEDAVRSQLADANYRDADIERAFENGRWLSRNSPERARTAVSYAKYHEGQERR